MNDFLDSVASVCPMFGSNNDVRMATFKDFSGTLGIFTSECCAVERTSDRSCNKIPVVTTATNGSS